MCVCVCVYVCEYVNGNDDDNGISMILIFIYSLHTSYSVFYLNHVQSVLITGL